MAGRQAKILSTTQVNAVLGVIAGNRHPARDRVMFLLSVKAGLRAKEIAHVTWGMVMTAEGQLADALHLEDRAAKMGSGRFVPLNRDLRDALMHLWAERQPKPEDPIIFSERGRSMSTQSVVRWFWDLYGKLGFTGCSSHSGRRSFITQAARKASTVGGSLRDVMELAGHKNLQTTSRYIEADTDAKRRLVNLV
ncbi:MAG: site-specific integrase [Niveispirillum sp.]|nr:site-specific integrase [Niveispirillum sp.]